ncbi:MAG TPA: response regulator transcription factor [Chloroflexota bacterium]|nr:response regulator transcription factor [Chloroflexota bacterium]
MSNAATSGERGTTRPRVLVVDDDANITAFLRRALAYEGYRVDTAEDGAAALALARDNPPDVAVLDVMLPGIDGVELTRRLRAGEMAGKHLPILMLTARDEVSDRVRGLDAGADDYLPKPFALEELTARLRTLLRRRAPDSQRFLRFADLTVDTSSREVRRGEREIQLTTKEYELLLFFMRHPRQVLTREQLLERVWGIDFEAETHVLEVYVGYLRKKLEQGRGGAPSAPLIHTIRGAGYVLRE